jgi:hypothetical protein
MDRFCQSYSVSRAQPGIAADRFAREIVGFLKVFPARSRQLNANPLDGGHQATSHRVQSIPSSSHK